MRFVIAHPTGNAFFKAAAQGFYNAGILQSVYTSLASFPGSLSWRIGGIKIFTDIRRRSMDSHFEKITHTDPWKETGRLLATKLRRQKLTAHETGRFSVDAVYRSLDNKLARNLEKEKMQGATAVYAYEDGALKSFEKAKKLGLQCFYDLPIGYWRSMQNLLSSEKELNLAWTSTLGSFKDSAEKLNRKDEEISLADMIIVASSFTKQTLNRYPGTLAPVRVVPYGFPPAKEKKYRSFERKQKLKLLFVGGLSQRKGLSYMFDAVCGLEEHIELTVIGRAEQYDCAPLVKNLNKYNWIESLPHHEVLNLMQENDLLLFPSLFEGFGQVITEAMAQGTPVITTERTAGPDFIEHGKNGWLVKAASAEAIHELLEHLLQHPNEIEAAGVEALKTAAARPWEIYQQELVQVVTSSLRGGTTKQSVG